MPLTPDDWRRLTDDHSIHLDVIDIDAVYLSEDHSGLVLTVAPAVPAIAPFQLLVHLDAVSLQAMLAKILALISMPPPPTP
jgi:hypothetical protein